MSEFKPITMVFSTSSSVVANTTSVFTTGSPGTSTTVYVSTAGGGAAGNVVFTGTGSLTLSNGSSFVAESIPRSPYNNLEPSVGSSSVSVYQVEALLNGGNSVSAVRREFPSLSRQEVNNAWTYAQNYPNPNANYPTKTLKDFVLNSDLHRLKETRTK